MKHLSRRRALRRPLCCFAGSETPVGACRPPSNGIRAGPQKFTDYHRSILAIRDQIEAHTGQRFRCPSYQFVRSLAWDSDAGLRLMANFPGYEYMAYLRHHGFPSPLLDWSKSPYIAAYFAFSEREGACERVAIFGYREYSVGKIGSPTAPQIVVRGPYVRTHRRHFLQQCHYTMCYQFAVPQWHYARHEDVFAGTNPALDQDKLWKFTVPRSERDRALGQLDKYNLNAYSLFGSEESLMQMLAARELRER